MMPLYKRKTLSQNNANDVATATLNEKTFKIPLVKTGIQLYKSSPKTLQSKIQENTQTSQKELKKVPSDFEFSIDNKESKQNLIHKIRKTNSKENHLSKGANVENNTRIVRNQKNGAKVGKKSDISKSINKKLKRKPKSKSNNSKLDLNNNINNEKLNKLKHKSIEIDIKSSKKLKQTNQHDTSSELDEMVISLWSQDLVPSNEPPKVSSHYEKLVWLQKQRNIGLYVCCDRCDKYRYLEDTVDPLELPDKWYCEMNPDEEHNKCSDPEVPLKSWQEAQLIYNTYHTGSVVWAKLEGYPWWPAMVDDDPDTEMYYWLDEYSCVPVWYHVVFFDSQTVSRAWLKPNALCSFKANIDNPMYQPLRRNKFKSRILFAKNQAEDAIKLTVADRLKKYSFLTRWKGRIGNPIDTDYNNKKLKRKRNYTKQKIRKTPAQDELSKSPPSKELYTQKGLNSSVDTNYLSPDLFEENEKELVNNVLSWI